jgi:uncharacterized repeat protein (TIGR01451 family)
MGIGTIENDDVPSISINDVSVSESTTPIFTVALSSASSSPVTVDFATADVTATGGSDYMVRAGTLTFDPGDVSEQIGVLLVVDSVDEPNETFTVNLSNSFGATITDAQGVATLLDDDDAPAFAIDDVSTAEGDAGTTGFTFTVTKIGSTAQTATVDYATADGTATTGDSDYASASGTLTFTPGDASETVTVNVTGDTIVEDDETFTLGLTNASQATILDDTGLGTITNDDAAPVSLSIDDVTATEGDSGTTEFTFTVSKTGSTTKSVTVDYSTADGSATTANSDYTSASGTLTFASGDDTKTVTVDVAGDAIEELEETFTVDLSNPANATISDDQGLGTIQNDDFTTADLSLTIDDDLDPVAVGEDLTYTIEVTNNGPAAAVDSAMALGLSNKTTFVSVSSSQGGCQYFPRKHAAACALGTLSSGQTVTVTIVVSPTRAPANPISAVAGVKSATTDPITTNNKARETTTVVP